MIYTHCVHAGAVESVEIESLEDYASEINSNKIIHYNMYTDHSAVHSLIQYNYYVLLNHVYRLRSLIIIIILEKRFSNNDQSHSPPKMRYVPISSTGHFPSITNYE